MAIGTAALDHIERLSVARIVKHRRSMLEVLRTELPSIGFECLTDPSSGGPVIAFSYKGDPASLKARLNAERIAISVYPQRIRISPSVYNRTDEVLHRIDELRRFARDSAWFRPSRSKSAAANGTASVVPSI
jgi:selenocysteine lyase/cysteine desulfurase